MKTANGPAHCNQCKRWSACKARQNRHRNASGFSGTRRFSCRFWPVFCPWPPPGQGVANLHSPAFLQAIACVKIGCPIPKMAVIFLFFYSFFCREFPLLPVPVRESPGRQAWGNHLDVLPSISRRRCAVIRRAPTSLERGALLLRCRLGHHFGPSIAARADRTAFPRDGYGL